MNVIHSYKKTHGMCGKEGCFMRWGKRLVSLVLAGCITVSTLPAMAAETRKNPFRDVEEGSWYYEHVLSAYERRLMSGVSDTEFQPNGVLSRAMVAQILYNYAGQPEVSGDAAFTDVASGKWYYNAVQWAAEHDVVSGMGDGRFAPESNVTREQLAVMLNNNAGRPEADGELDFPDQNQVSSWAREAILWANQNGIINGTKLSDGTVLLKPRDNATRAQAASMILKYVDVLEEANRNPEDPADEAVSFVDFYADISNILVGTTETVTFYAEVESEQPVSGDAIILRNEYSRAVAHMHDDGENGDAEADDGIFTAQIEIEAKEQSRELYHASYYNGVNSTEFLINCYLDLTDEQLAAGEPVMDSLQEIAAQHVETGDTDADLEQAKQSYQEMLDYLAQQKAAGSIDRYAAEEDGIHFYTPYQIHYVLYYESLLTAQDTQAAPAAQKNAASDSYTTDTYSEICTLQPFNWQHPDDHLGSAASRIEHTDLPYEWTSRLVDGQVTVERMKELGQYHVILLDSHGGVNSIATGEEATEASRETYKADLQADLVSISGVSGGGDRDFFVVGDLFFRQNYRAGDMNNSIIYVGTCHGADSEELSDALRHAGAAAVMAYENSVYTSYCEEMCEEVCKNLCNNSGEGYPTLSKAIRQAKDALGEKDTSELSWSQKFGAWLHGKGAAELKLFGDSGFRLDCGYISGNVRKAANGYRVKPIVRLVGVSSTANTGLGSFGVRANQGTYDVRVCAYGCRARTVRNVSVRSGVTTYLSDSRLLMTSDSNQEITGRIMDAATGEAIPNVTIRFREDHNNTSGDYVTVAGGEAYTITADENGGFATTDLPVGYYTMEAVRDGYITQYKDIVVGTGDYNEVSMSQVLQEGTYRIVLKWNDEPRDLDSHVVGTLSSGDSFHTYYSYKSQYDGETEVCNLDLDDTDGNGPETITLKPTTTEPYYYYIYRYAGDGTVATSGAHIEVYNGESCIRTFDVPTDQGDGDYWNVFAIVNGTLVVNNTITDEANISYAGTAEHAENAKGVNGMSESSLKAETETGKK